MPALHRRAEQLVPLQRGFDRRQLRQRAPHRSRQTASRASASSIRIQSGHARAAATPRRTAPTGRAGSVPARAASGVLIFGFLLQLQHVSREELERAVEKQLEAADRHARHAPRSRVAAQPRDRRGCPAPLASAPRRAIGSGSTSGRRGSSASASEYMTRASADGDRSTVRPNAADVRQQQRRLDDRVVFEEERRQPTRCAADSDQIAKRGARAVQRLALSLPRGSPAPAPARAARAAMTDRARCAARVRAIRRRPGRRSAHRRSRRSARPARRRICRPGSPLCSANVWLPSQRRIAAVSVATSPSASAS